MPTPSQLLQLTPANAAQDPLNRLRAFRAAQEAMSAASKGSPAFTGPPVPPASPITPAGTIVTAPAGSALQSLSKLAGKAAPYAAGAAITYDVGRRLLLNNPEDRKREVRSDMENYLTTRGLSPYEVTSIAQEASGTEKSSPEENYDNAQQGVAKINSTLSNMHSDRMKSRGYDPSNMLVRDGQKGQTLPTRSVVPSTVNTTYIPSPAEEAARRGRMAGNTIATPQGVANIQRGTGIVETPITNSQEAERVRLASIASRISPENPYGANVTNSALRTGQVRVGAATDAEAAKNLANSALQNQATANRVAEINNATNALKDLRAARLGISRSELDSGRSAPPLVVGEAGGGFGSDILDRDRFLRQFEPSPGKVGNAKIKANTAAAQEVWNQNQQAKQKPTILPQASAVDPLDMGRFLLDQQKFGWQQNVDKGRLAADMTKVQDSASGTALEKQKYADERRKNFMETFSYPDKDAPQAQLGALTLLLSDSTGGQIPPELMVGYLQKAAEMSKVDWKDARPKSLTALGELAMKLAVQDYR